MQRRQLFVIDPVSAINPTTDSSFYLMLEAKSRGVAVHWCTPEQLLVKSDTGYALSEHIDVFRSNEGHYAQIQVPELLPLSAFEAVWMRKDPPVNPAFMAALWVLAFHEDVPVINDPRGIALANEKLWVMSKASNYMPETVVSSQPSVLLAAARDFGTFVMKPLLGAAGSGVMLMQAHDKNVAAALELLLSLNQPVIVQRAIPDAHLGDKRIILVGGEPVGAVLRVPSGSDHRANLHVGGRAQKADISTKEREIAAHLKPFLLALGLHFVGIDVINGYLTEVNVTSPTGLQEIDHLDGRTGTKRLNSIIMDYVEQNLL